MALAKDLIGVGIAPEAAQRLGSIVATVTTAGSSATDATVLGKDATLVLVDTGGGSQGVKLPANAELGIPYILGNISGTAALIYPPALGQINGDTATTGTVPLTARGTSILIRVTNTQWISVGGAAG